MSIFRTSARILLAAALVTAGLAAAQEIPLMNWAAPAHWQPPATDRDTSDGNLAFARTAREPFSARQPLALPSGPLPLIAINPCRQYDSRSATPLLENTPQTITLTGAPCGIPANAQAISVNITVFNITGAGSNGVFKVGITSPPPTAWINYPKTETQRGNAGVVALTDTGGIVVQVNQGAGSVDFTVDVNGYFAPGAAGTGGFLSGGPTEGLLGAALADFPFINPAAISVPSLEEHDNSAIAPVSCSAGILARVDVAPGGTTPITFTLRVNGVNTATTCTIATSGTSCFSSTSSGITAGALLSLGTSGPTTFGSIDDLWVGLACQ